MDAGDDEDYSNCWVADAVQHSHLWALTSEGADSYMSLDFVMRRAMGDAAPEDIRVLIPEAGFEAFIDACIRFKASYDIYKGVQPQ